MPVSATAVTVKQDNKFLTPTAQGSTATLVKLDNKFLTATVITRQPIITTLTTAAIATATLLKSVAKSYTAVTPPAAFVLKSVGKIKTTTTIVSVPSILAVAAQGAKVLTASVTATATSVVGQVFTLITGSSISLPPIFSNASPLALLSQVFVPGRVLTASVTSSSVMNKIPAIHLSALVTSTATIVAQIALAVRLLSATVTSTAALANQNALSYLATVSPLADVQRLTNASFQLVLSAVAPVSAFLSWLTGEDIPVTPSQDGLTETPHTRGGLTLTSITKGILRRKDLG